MINGKVFRFILFCFLLQIKPVIRYTFCRKKQIRKIRSRVRRPAGSNVCHAASEKIFEDKNKGMLA